MTIQWNLPTTIFIPNLNFGATYQMPTFGALTMPNFIFSPVPQVQYPKFNFKFNFNFSSPSQPLSNNNFGSLTSSNQTNYSGRLSGGFGQNIVSTALKYKGYNESDGSYKLFTNGRTEAWCADFVTHVVKESARKSGKSLNGFGSASVSQLRQWGKDNGCYLQTDNLSNKTDTIKKQVKPGDVIIFKNGKSHTGIVKSVDTNGRITTIEGNTSDMVAERHYAATDRSISGFVQIA